MQSFCCKFQFRNADDASVALTQMNGFPLAGRPLKVGRSERSASFPDVGEVETFMTTTTAMSIMSNPLAAATAVAAGLVLFIFVLQLCEMKLWRGDGRAR